MPKVPAPFPLYEESDREWWRWHFAGKALTGVIASEGFWEAVAELSVQEIKQEAELVAMACRSAADHLVKELEKSNAIP